MRYIITLTKRQNGYQAIIRQTGNQPRQLDNLRLGATDCITIKNQDIPLSKIVTALQTYDENWLAQWFGERGQLELGRHLYGEIFKNQQFVTEAELCIICDDEHINHLPWTLLVHNGVFLTMAGWSVQLSPHDQFMAHRLPALPRMLIVAPEPVNESPTGAALHVAGLEKLLTQADSGLKPVIVCTWQDFIREIKENPPDVLYYYGHGISDGHSSRLVFADGDNQSIDIPVADLVPLLRTHPPRLAYFNCCSGDAGGVLGVGKQLGGFIPAVLTSRTIALVSAAQVQALSFWQATLLDGIAPHLALRLQLGQLAELNLSVGDIRWLTPVLHRSYDRWTAYPQDQLKNSQRDPHWRLRLDRFKQFSAVHYQTVEMLRNNKPKALAYLWYGRSDQGIEVFHQRLNIELKEKLANTFVHEIRPDWLPVIRPYCFKDMLCQAFRHNSNFDYLGDTLSNICRTSPLQKTLIYVRHQPVDFNFNEETKFHPDFIKEYLNWWNHNFVTKLPDNCHALLGLSYQVEEPSRFREGLVKRGFDDFELSDTVFDLLDELEKVNKQDVRKFLKEHNILLPEGVKDGTIIRILEETDGDYHKVLDALQNIERHGWDILIEHRNKDW